MDQPQQQNTLLSTKETRERLGNISHSTIYNFLNSGKLTSVKLGSRRLIDSNSVDKLIEESRSAPNASRRKKNDGQT